MIRLREFNMAELEYFIDPEEPLEHDFSSWSSIELNLIDGEGNQHSMSLSNAVETGLVRHATVGFLWVRP